MTISVANIWMLFGVLFLFEKYVIKRLLRR